MEMESYMGAINRIKLPEAKLSHLFRMERETGEACKTGTLTIVPVIGGNFKGKRLRGTIIPGGADWDTAVEGVVRIDSKYNLKTDDGALISMDVNGWECDGRRQAHLLFTCGNKKYKWLTNAIIVAESGIGEDGKPYLDAFEVL